MQTWFDWQTFNWFPLNREGEDVITLFLFFLDVALLPINCGATISGHKLDLAPLPINLIFFADFPPYIFNGIALMASFQPVKSPKYRGYCQATLSLYLLQVWRLSFGLIGTVLRTVRENILPVIPGWFRPSWVLLPAHTGAIQRSPARCRHCRA